MKHGLTAGASALTIRFDRFDYSTNNRQRQARGKTFEGEWTNAGYRSMLRAMTLSARNRLEGKIEELQLGGVMAHVAVRVGGNLIESVITRRSAEEMKLKIGDTVAAVIKSTEVMLEKK